MFRMLMSVQGYVCVHHALSRDLSVDVTRLYRKRGGSTTHLASGALPDRPLVEDGALNTVGRGHRSAVSFSTCTRVYCSSQCACTLTQLRQGSMPLTFFYVLLNDAAVLLRASVVVELPQESIALQTQSASDPPSVQPESKASSASVDDLSSHPKAYALLALSDLCALFTVDSPASRPDAASKAKVNHVAHKLTFYAAYVLGVPPILLRSLVTELAERAESIKQEGASPVSVGERKAGEETGGQSRATKIVELS